MRARPLLRQRLHRQRPVSARARRLIAAATARHVAARRPAHRHSTSRPSWSRPGPPVATDALDRGLCRLLAGRRACVLRDHRAPGGADTDNRDDVYERAGGTTTLVSTGRRAATAASTPSSPAPRPTAAQRASSGRPSGSTPPTTTASPTSTSAQAAPTTLVSTGPAGGNGRQGAFFDGASADGATGLLPHRRAARGRHGLAGRRVRARGGATRCRLDRRGGRQRRLPRVLRRRFRGRDPRLLRHRRDAGEPADTDSVQDVYERTAWHVLMSIGPAGGNGAFPAYFDAVSRTGARVIFPRTRRLTPPTPTRSSTCTSAPGGTMSPLSATATPGTALRRALHGQLRRRRARLLRDRRAAGDRRHRRSTWTSSTIGYATITLVLGRGTAPSTRRSRAPRPTAATCSSRPRRPWRRTPTPTWTSTTAPVRPRSSRPAPPAATAPTMPSFADVSDDGARVFFTTRRAWWPPTRTGHRLYERAGGTTSLRRDGQRRRQRRVQRSLRGRIDRRRDRDLHDDRAAGRG